MPTTCPSALASRVEAEILALRALGFVAGDADHLDRFVARTGVATDEMTRQAADPQFLGAVLDFVLGDEPLLLAFAERVGVRPETPYEARRRLAGPPIAG